MSSEEVHKSVTSSNANLAESTRPVHPPPSATGVVSGLLGVLYSGLAYLCFLAVFVYLALWTAGVLVPFTIHTGPLALDTSLWLAGVVNVTLLLSWGVQHSLMARKGFKAWVTRLVPASLERSTFVLASSLWLAGVMALWQPMPAVVWQVDNATARIALFSLQALGWLGVPLASFMIDHFDLFGLKQPYLRLRNRRKRTGSFATPLAYRYVRHPMMFGFIIGFWSAPDMSVGRLILALVMTAYIRVGTRYEEQDLVGEFGDDYRRYQHSTPRLVPGLRSGKQGG